MPVLQATPQPIAVMLLAILHFILLQPFAVSTCSRRKQHPQRSDKACLQHAAGRDAQVLRLAQQVAAGQVRG